MPGYLVLSQRQTLNRHISTPLTKEERDDLWRTGGFPDWDYDPQQGEPEPFEYKPSDWGWLNGKIVALDYSATVD